MRHKEGPECYKLSLIGESGQNTEDQSSDMNVYSKGQARDILVGNKDSIEN